MSRQCGGDLVYAVEAAYTNCFMAPDDLNGNPPRLSSPVDTRGKVTPVFLNFTGIFIVWVLRGSAASKDTYKMSGAHESNRKRRPPKMFLISTDLKVQDQLDGPVRLQRGFMCQEQERIRGDCLWVKVLTRLNFDNIQDIHQWLNLARGSTFQCARKLWYQNRLFEESVPARVFPAVV